MSAETSKNEGTCFVTMAFGRKTDWETGRTFDLDKVYRHLIQPAVEAAGLKCIRGDEIVQLGPIDIPMYDQLLKADVVVADLSTSRGSVFYELGIRHALRPFTTIIIAEDRIGYLPFDTNIVPFLQYHHLGEDIGHDEVLRFRPLLTAAIVERLEKDPRPTDSPVYLFLTDLGPRNLEFLIERARISGELMLDLRNLSLRVLPNSLRKLEQVETLNLSGNELSALPDWIGQLPQLQTLDLSNNELISLPESLGDLPYLKELDLSNNQISALPPSLSRLTSLTRLALGGNRELGLSSDVLMAKPADIFKYYFRLRGPRRPWNEAKVILVGRGGVGKTCLVNRLLYDRFDQDEKETDGIRITPWKFLLDGKEEVQVNVWDFGGQEIMHATHQFFLTERCIYLLVLSGREGGADADVEYWLQLIESFGSESSVIIVLNKINKHPFDLNRRALQQKYPSIREFVKTDCQARIGLENLRSIIERETNDSAHLRDALPTAWFDIKERLAAMAENYVSFEQYREICEELGETDREGQELLATRLHWLGVALNFKDDPRLRDTHVLNPHWVTNGIYKILNAEKLARQKGLLYLSDVQAILDTKIYPESKHGFLLDLMKKFELCFEFPEDPSRRYLVPELLDNQEPELRAAFDPGECLHFQYRYSILPEGFLPRFIVRTHILISNFQYWRSGVVLEFEGNRALVKADVRDRKVSISVTGPVEGRRRLLAIIRSDFERIHGDTKKLQVDELVPIKGRPDMFVPYAELKVREKTRMQKFSAVFNNALVELDVQEMLNGVDLEGSRSSERGPAAAVLLFYSYSHKDEKLRSELETHLKLLQRLKFISTWHDRRITAGEEWKGKIDECLESADIILLLVSSDFIASDYCYDLEMNRALERHHNHEARVIPVILRDVDWQGAPFGKLQVLPRDGDPVELWSNRDSAWKDVALGIRRTVEEVLESRASGS